MTLPSLIAFVFTLASPPPSLQTDLSAYSVSVQKKDLRWLGKQFLNALFFPIAAIGRYDQILNYFILQIHFIKLYYLVNYFHFRNNYNNSGYNTVTYVYDIGNIKFY